MKFEFCFLYCPFKWSFILLGLEELLFDLVATKYLHVVEVVLKESSGLYIWLATYSSRIRGCHPMKQAPCFSSLMCGHKFLEPVVIKLHVLSEVIKILWCWWNYQKQSFSFHASRGKEGVCLFYFGQTWPPALQTITGIGHKYLYDVEVGDTQVMA